MNLNELDLLSPEIIEWMKIMVNKTPDKWLKYHLEHSVKNELYEVAAYIKKVAERRGVDLT